MIINIANINININLIYEKDFKTLPNYLSNDSKIDSIISSTFNEYKSDFGIKFMETKYYDKYKNGNKIIQHQKNIDGTYYAVIEYDNKNINIYNDKNNKFQDEYLLFQYAINYLIDKYTNSILFHSSSIIYNNLGIIFSAKSGTGKSTHRRLWEKYGNAICINDDKNIITLENDKLYILPNPCSGKHMKDNNIKSELNIIVFLYQSKDNIINKLSKKEAFKLLLGQINVPNDDNKDKWNKIIDKLLELPIYHYGCNMEMDAYLTLKERILNDYANK